MLLVAPFVIALIIGIFLLVSVILRWLWNMTMPEVFGIKKITYWQALRILIISAILFNGNPNDEARKINNTVEDISEKLDMIIEQKYDNDKILVIGDSPGDLYAAKNVEALFYPILPTKEIHAWDNFNKEYLDVFLKGDYSGEKEKRQIEEFNTILKSTPPWAK